MPCAGTVLFPRRGGRPWRSDARRPGRGRPPFRRWEDEGVVVLGSSISVSPAKKRFEWTVDGSGALWSRLPRLGFLSEG